MRSPPIPTLDPDHHEHLCQDSTRLYRQKPLLLTVAHVHWPVRPSSPTTTAIQPARQPSATPC